MSDATAGPSAGSNISAEPAPASSIIADAEHVYELLLATEARTRTLEYELSLLAKTLVVAEQRTRTLEYLASETLYIARYQADLLHKVASDVAASHHEGSNVWFQAEAMLELHTEHPIAADSNDHLHPDSTNEGMVRPTQFVRHCIETLGQNIRCLDLGTGAAGLVYEFAKHQVMAVGVDGTDFNKRHHVGYWPFIPHNLFTCDITHPFRFIRRASGTIHGFDLISMWEVLEHISETRLPQLLTNVREHLLPSGYFVGSVSLLEYVAPDGTPYHVTLKPRAWWRERFAESGLRLLDQHPFNTSFFCRGIGGRFQDVHDYRAHPEAGFHFVAQH